MAVAETEGKGRMKIPVTLKDPDTMQDSVEEAMRRLQRPTGISREEWVEIQDARADSIKAAISDKFMRYGEYLDIEFDVDEALNVEVRVLPVR